MLRGVELCIRSAGPVTWVRSLADSTSARPRAGLQMQRIPSTSGTAKDAVDRGPRGLAGGLSMRGMSPRVAERSDLRIRRAPVELLLASGPFLHIADPDAAIAVQFKTRQHLCPGCHFVWCGMDRMEDELSHLAGSLQTVASREPSD